MDRYNIWFAYVMGVNCINSLEIIQSGYSPREFYADRENLRWYRVFTERQMETAAATTLDDVEKICKAHEKHGIKSMNYLDEIFPQRLKEIPHAPLVLFYKGNPGILAEKYTVAVVGSRRCNGEGERACSLIAADVAKLGGVVVSGLAQGIDTVAHRACVENGGRTVAFTGVPLDECFPKSNEKFQKKLEEEHLVISEYVSGYEYHGTNFIFRNRLIAGAGDGLCVVQAKNRSGSLATVGKAIEYDKPVFTVPGSIFSPAYEGSNRLLTEGKAMAVTDGVQIMKYLGAEIPDEKENKKEKKPDTSMLSEMAQQVLNTMDGAMFSSRIVKSSGKPAGLVKAAITELEISGFIIKTDNGEYIRKK